MFFKSTQALILSGCLIAAGTASANDRNVIVPVIAGAAVGAVLASVLSHSGHDRRPQQGYYDYRPQPAYPQRYQPVAYVPVATEVEYRRFTPPPPHRFYGGDRGYGRGYEQGYDRGYDRGYGHYDNRRYDNRW